MKKIIIIVSLCFTILFSSESIFLYIDELKYMNKDELINEYIEQTQLVELKLERSKISVDTATAIRKKGLSDGGKNLEEAKALLKEVEFHKRNKVNIKRILRKDFNIDEKEFEKFTSNVK